MRRVLVTGSRDWVDQTVVWSALNSELQQFPGGILVVHGGARGTDDIANRWAWGMHDAGFRVQPELHAADWESFGKAGRDHPQSADGRPRCRRLSRIPARKAGPAPDTACPGLSRRGIRVVNHGFQPHSQQAQEFAEAYLSTTPKPTRECSL